MGTRSKWDTGAHSDMVVLQLPGRHSLLLFANTCRLCLSLLAVIKDERTALPNVGWGRFFGKKGSPKAPETRCAVSFPKLGTEKLEHRCRMTHAGVPSFCGWLGVGGRSCFNFTASTVLPRLSPLRHAPTFHVNVLLGQDVEALPGGHRFLAFVALLRCSLIKVAGVVNAILCHSLD